jgi:hypothetical protein
MQRAAVSVLVVERLAKAAGSSPELGGGYSHGPVARRMLGTLVLALVITAPLSLLAMILPMAGDVVRNSSGSLRGFYLQALYTLVGDCTDYLRKETLVRWLMQLSAECPVLPDAVAQEEPEPEPELEKKKPVQKTPEQ